MTGVTGGWTSLTRAGGLAAIVGGVCWVIKGGGILVTGDQPPLLFEIAPPLFAVALIALASAVKRSAGRGVRAGEALAYAAVALWLVAVVLFLAGVEASEDSFTATNAVVFGGFLCTLAALVLLGVVAGRSKMWPSPWRWLPLAMGVSIVPLMVIGGVLETVNERLLEVPIVLYGLAWATLGALLWRYPEGRKEGGSPAVDSASQKTTGEEAHLPC